MSFNLGNNIIYHRITTTHFCSRFLCYFRRANISYKYFRNNIRLCSYKKADQKKQKGVIQKLVLICNRNKIYIDEGEFARDTTSCKCDCLFDIVVLIENKL